MFCLRDEFLCRFKWIPAVGIPYPKMIWYKPILLQEISSNWCGSDTFVHFLLCQILTRLIFLNFRCFAFMFLWLSCSISHFTTYTSCCLSRISHSQYDAVLIFNDDVRIDCFPYIDEGSRDAYFITNT